MSDLPFIPFVRTESDDENVADFYSDAPVVRVALDKSKAIKKERPKQKLWIDLGIDGVESAFLENHDARWKTFINRYGDLKCLTDPDFLKRPERKVIQHAITASLCEAMTHHPQLISVPQLPYEEGVKHNKINRVLAEITADWRKTQSPIELILPVIFTHQSQLNKKTERNPSVKFAQGLLSKFGIDALWSVDSTLDDQACIGNFERVRFRGIIEFFEELRAGCQLKRTIAGPYWGLGMVLWARGLVTHFGMGIGSSYRYYTPGKITQSAKARVAITPIRRWTSSSNGLVDWLRTAQTKLPPGSAEHTELGELLKHFPTLLAVEPAKRQVARVYRRWIDKMVSSPPGGRAVGLFQDLSAAFVTGKMLTDLPDEDGPARRPERVAEQLMLNCL